MGERVFVYMPKEKANKTTSLPDGDHSTTEVLDTGVIVRPVHRPQEGSIWAALNRIHRCPHAMASDVI